MTLEDISAERNMNSQNRRKLTRTLVAVLRRAQIEKRLTCALMPAIKMLESDPSGALFCILPQSRQGDTARHIHYVLLQAFCYENNIKIVKVDNADKLAAILSVNNPRLDCSCVLVHQQPWATDQHPLLSQPEKDLAAYCDTTAEMHPPPIIQLPES